jgi:hypothetical protein
MFRVLATDWLQLRQDSAAGTCIVTVPLDGFGDHVLERVVVAVVLKDRHPGVRWIEHMINKPALGGSMRSSHAGSNYPGPTPPSRGNGS